MNRERIATRCVCCGSTDLRESPSILMPFVAHRTFGWAPVEIDASWGLQTIRSGMAYALCRSLACATCDLLFCDLRFSDEELGRLYADYRGQAYNQLRESYEPGYTQRNKRLNAGVSYLAEIEAFLAPHLRSPLTVLDWGGDTGKNTPFRDGADAVEIYDISEKAVLPGCVVVSRAQAQARRYALIVCCNVLEHVPYPETVLRDILPTMDPDSVLYLEVPFEELMVDPRGDRHLRKRHWHEHINFYSEASLRALLDRVGLEVVALRHLQATAGGNSSWLFQIACRVRPSSQHGTAPDSSA